MPKLDFTSILIVTVSTYKSANAQANSTISSLNIEDSTKLPFREYIEKYSPKNVWERVIEVSKAAGKSFTNNDTIDALLQGLDETDDLLALKVQKTNPQVVEEHDGRRRWFPPGRLVTRLSDTYSLRQRIFGLIQTAIYQARNSMATMQRLRSKYRGNSLYKMGYLMSKTDNSCKTFAKFAKFAFRYCSLFRYEYFEMRTKLRDMMYIEERQLSLWFQVELLIDLVKLNDDNCRQMLLDVQWNRKEAWKFVDKK